MLVEAVGVAPVGETVGVGDGVGVALGDGHGVADALLTGDALLVGDAVDEGVVDGLGVAVGVAEALALGVAEGLTDPLADGEADAVVIVVAKHGADVGPRITVLPPENDWLPPFRIRAAGTTRIPMMTVMTKASAPNSWRQKAHDELRISLRPAPVVAYCAC